MKLPLLAALATLAFVTSTAAQPKLPAFGMSYSFLDVDVSKVAQCKASRGATMKTDAFLPRYDQPGVREKVKATLTQMHRSGFQAVRTLVWFGKKKEGDADWFDVADPARAAKLIRQYQEDVATAGFVEAMLVFAAGGTSTGICRKQEWGDCFDEHSVVATSDFIITIRRSLSDKPPAPIFYDLAGESCPPDKPPLLKKALEINIREIVGRYTSLFPKDQTSVSCTIQYFDALNAQRTTDRLYGNAGPSAYLLATYDLPSFNTRTALTKLLRDRADKNKPFIISETSYNTPEHLKLILDSFVTARASLQSVYFWPLHDTNTNCHMDVAPPYNLYEASGGLFGVRPQR